MVRRAATARLAAMAVATIAVCSGWAAAQGAAAGEPLEATEVGVTRDEIRIAVVADVENQLAPGLFEGAVDALRGFERYINDHGGLAGREVVVDFLDSKLSADDARNAIIKACQDDFAVVGTSALFLNNVDDLLACPDKAGVATGLPDLPGVATELVQACSPVSFPVNAPTIVCATKDQSPQEYRGNVGSTHYYRQRFGDDLHGVTVNTNDLASAHNAIEVGYELAQAAGITVDAEFNVSARSPQSAYTPIIQAIKDTDATIVLDGLSFASNIALRKEARLQGVTGVKVWSCAVSCYDRGFLEQGGADVEGHFVPLTFLPFEETTSNAMLRSFVRYVGKDKVTGLGASAWAAAVLFRDAVERIVARGGENALTRATLLETLGGIHDFDADGMFGTVDIGNRLPSPCGVITQVRDGEFVRVRPKRPGTLRCDRANMTAIERDLRSPGP
jgi:hypothetical protein